MLQAFGSFSTEPQWSLRSGDPGSFDSTSGAVVRYIPPPADTLIAATEVHVTATAGSASATVPIAITKAAASGTDAPAPTSPATTSPESSTPTNSAQARLFSIMAQNERATPGGERITLTASKPSADDTVAWSLDAGSPGSLDRSGGDTAQYIPPPAGSVADSVAVVVNGTIGATTKKTTIFLEGARGLSLLAGNDFGASTVNTSGRAARFQRPYGVARDAQGNLYVTDGGRSIRKITPEGSVSMFAGTANFNSSASVDGTGTSARFAGINDIAIDTAGNLYTADSFDNTIRKITPSGVVTTFAGQYRLAGNTNGTGTGARFDGPSGITVDAAGNLYVSDTGNKMIRKITSAGVVTTVAQDDPAAPMQFKLLSSPRGIAVDSTGNLYVVDQAKSEGFCCAENGNRIYFSSSAIRKITPQGVVTTLAGWHGMGQDSYTQGNPAHGSQDGSGNNAMFENPAGITIDASGNLYVTDSGNNTIRKITPAGLVSTLAGTAGSRGSADGIGTSARFFTPLDIAVDPEGNLYVADSLNSTIRQLAAGGDVITLAGTALRAGNSNGTGMSALFDGPAGIVSDAQGDLYVADNWNNAVRKITPSGEVSTFAGSSGSYDSTAYLAAPTNMAIDGIGNVYVGNPASIRKISPTGVVSLHLQIGHTSFGLAGDADGNLYTGDKYAGIERISPAGVRSPILDKPLQAATRNISTAFSADRAGNVYVYMTGTGDFKKVSRDRVVTTIGTALPGGFGSAAPVYVSQLTVDEQGNLYVLYRGARTIVQKIAQDGVASIILEYDRDSTSSGNHIDVTRIATNGLKTLAITTNNGIFLLRMP
ncbi:MAG: hypothetical protein A3I66_19215 [Burkholderiales bacterium RIFCSPLOWO2_02_FULL_57_36]|nr:MAG: hypothetical protein A3I66_19215 [Burkholderiales bacterium RIFCSPLOWO2_02_FULL_57_36]